MLQHVFEEFGWYGHVDLWFLVLNVGVTLFNCRIINCLYDFVDGKITVQDTATE